MKIGFVADVHVANHRIFGGTQEAGINRRCQQVLDVLAKAVRVAAKAGCDTFVVLGDLFDTTTPEPQVTAGVQRAVEAGDHHMNVMLMLGNHDQVSTDYGDHSLGPLRPLGEVVEKPVVFSYMTLVPFQPGPAKDWLPEMLAKHCGSPRWSPAGVLGLHLGIEGKDTPPFLRGAPDSVTVQLLRELQAQYGFSHVVAGNWHHRRLYKGGILQVGTLAPTGFDNPGVDGYGTLAIVDTDKPGEFSIVRLPGPRFLSLYGPPGELMRELGQGTLSEQLAGCQVYVRWQVPPENLQEAREELAAKIAEGSVVDGEVQPDPGAAQAAARTAAQAAKAGATLDEALAAFVKEMPLEDGVDRDSVLARARTYLQR